MVEGGHHLSVSHQMTVSDGFSLMVWIYTELDRFHWQFCMGGGHHLSLSHQMTVSNGFTLTVWKHIAVTFSSSSFKWGRTLAKVGSSARFELISSFALASQSSFVSINRNERPTRN